MGGVQKERSANAALLLLVRHLKHHAGFVNGNDPLFVSLRAKFSVLNLK